MSDQKFTSIDSHSSYLTNREMHILFIQADSLSLTASTTMHYQDIVAFHNAVDLIYANVSSVVAGSIDEINKLRKTYKQIKNLVQNDPRFRTHKALEFMLDLTREIYIKVRQSLQTSEYFFRISKRQTKGLSSIGFYVNDSIFSAGDNDAGQEEETEQD